MMHAHTRTHTYAVSQVSYNALARLVCAMPGLTKLSLPVLGSRSAAALTHVPRSLASLSVTVADAGVLDQVLGIKTLRYLSVGTRKGLLYLMMSQCQV